MFARFGFVGRAGVARLGVKGQGYPLVVYPCIRNVLCLVASEVDGVRGYRRESHKVEGSIVQSERRASVVADNTKQRSSAT